MTNVERTIARVLIQRHDEARARVEAAGHLYAQQAPADDRWAPGDEQARLALARAEGELAAYRNSLAIVAGAAGITTEDWHARLRAAVA